MRQCYAETFALRENSSTLTRAGATSGDHSMEPVVVAVAWRGGRLVTRH